MFVETKKEGEVRTKIEPWRQLLLDAADYMERNGWCCNLLENSRGNVCARGAMFRAQGAVPPGFYSGAPNVTFMEADRRLSDFVGRDAAGFSNDQGDGVPVIVAMRACAAQ